MTSLITKRFISSPAIWPVSPVALCAIDHYIENTSRKILSPPSPPNALRPPTKAFSWYRAEDQK